MPIETTLHPPDNPLYLAVLPLVHYSRAFGGATYEEVMTLVPDRNFATEFGADVVDLYINTFISASDEKFTGRTFRGYKFEKFGTGDGIHVYVVVSR